MGHRRGGVADRRLVWLRRLCQAQIENAFNFGLRAYYFAMGALAWFVHPLALVGSTIWVVIVLYKREFQSKALEAMEHEIGRPWKP